jgi:hypothetical protein
MRFYSHWIHIIWLYKITDYYYPFETKTLNTVVLFSYGVMGGCDYTDRMYKVWHKRLHAVNEDPNVADAFSLGEFFIAFLASISSVYWFLDTLIVPWVWLIILVAAWSGHYLIAKRWKFHFDKLERSAYRHVSTA